MASEARAAEIIVAIWDQVGAPTAHLDRHDWTKQQIETEIARRFPKRGKGDLINAADVKYTYDARRPLPNEITIQGERAIVGRGPALYSFRRIPQPNLIKLPVLDAEPLKDAIHPRVAEVLGDDEQSVLSRVASSDLLDRIIGRPTLLAQSHKRTTLPHVGQFEVDCIFVTTDGPRVVIPISMKGGTDNLSYSQAFVLNNFARSRFPKHEVRSLGIHMDRGFLTVVEFSPEVEVENIRVLGSRCFRLAPTYGEGYDEEEFESA